MTRCSADPSGAFGSDGAKNRCAVTTDRLDKRDRFDFWREVICRPYVELDALAIGEIERFHGSAARIGAGPVRHVRAAPSRATRTPATIARAEEDYFQVSLMLDGTGLLVQDERTAVLRPGNFALFDSTRPYMMQFEQDHSMFVLMISHSLFPTVLPRASAATAVTVNGREGSAALLRPLFENLMWTADTTPPMAQQHLMTAAIELVAATLAERTPLSTYTPMRAAHLARAKAYIAGNLWDSELSPETIARAVFVSERYLHALFRESGTSVSRYVMVRRLDRAYHDLTDPCLAHVPVAQVAAGLGFKCPKHFTRTFKAEYGLTPRDHRKGERPLQPLAPADNPANMGQAGREHEHSRPHGEAHRRRFGAGGSPDAGSTGRCCDPATGG